MSPKLQNPSLRPNNFDLIRLLAAFQVVYVHAVGHTELLEAAPPWALSLLYLLASFPGVAVFFVVSGFLVSQSYERLRESPGIYFQHRALRIFPALVLCLLVSLGILYFFGFLGPEVTGSATFWAWLVGQLTFIQFFNPEFFRGFGLGVVNPAMWTISVELQYYLALPIFYALARPVSGSAKLGKALLWSSFVLSFAAFCFVDKGMNDNGGFGAAGIATKLLFVSLVPHWWMFVLGMAIQRHFTKIRGWLEGRFLFYLLGYILIAGFREGLLGRDTAYSAVYYFGYLPERVLLALMVVSGAYSARWLSCRILGRTDISYGVYLYHCLVINVFIQLGIMNSMGAVAGVYLVAILCGILSWLALEKRALSFKIRRSRPRGGSALGFLPPLPSPPPSPLSNRYG